MTNKPSGRLLTFKYESASAKLVVWENGTATVSSVYSEQRQKGHASGVMKIVVDYADEHNLRLQLKVQRYGYSDKIALNNKQLISFYSKFGFVRMAGSKDILMVRKKS